MDSVVAAPSVKFAAEGAFVPDLSARRAVLMRRRRAGAAREWLGAVAVGGFAVWMTVMAVVALVAR